MVYSFLLIGQSNMAGRGDLNEVSPIKNDNILMYRSNKWLIAQEPVHTDKPELAGIGLCMSFADYLSNKYDINIGLIPCAVGGTSLDEWAPGDTLYKDAVKKAKKALQSSKLSGILWHQGEADSKDYEKASTYKDRFIKMIDSLLSDLGFENDDLPIIVGELGEFLKDKDTQPNFEITNKQIKLIAEEGDNFAFVSAKGLNDKGDKLHFDSLSLRELGLRYAKAFEGLAKF